MDAHPIDAEQLYGTWRLVRSRAVDATGNPIRDPWGPEPMGRLVLARNGRMMAVLCDGRLSLPEGKKRAYSSYCGNYVYENGLLTTIIDAASDPSRIGSSQPRRVALRDGALVLMPPTRKDGERREIFWHLEARL
ncbi:lipocalin-like domain-containing protein [Antarctobacter sp.]|uniref:lipocalin-like domain-containing protein n=1 Tax=Antarctobacter sp. TaxID=1872577 RepID=UPI003A8DE083